MGSFNYAKPSAKELFQVIVQEPEKYEKSEPIKRVRENLMYTIKNHTVESIACDDNGAYNKSNGNTKIFHVSFSSSSLSVRIAHAENGKFFCKFKDGRLYTKNEVPREEVYELERYYRWNKTFPQLKRTICRVKKVDCEKHYPFFCVIYYFDGNLAAHDEIEILPHGNSKKEFHLKRPYIRTEPSVLREQEALLRQKKSPSEVYDIVNNNSGGPMRSSSMSKEPRNLKQVQNRKAKSNFEKDNCAMTTGQAKDDPLSNLIKSQVDPTSMLKTLTITGSCYIAFAYTKKQIQDIEQFCCLDVDCSILAIDTTFNLCNFWITDTAYRNRRILNPDTGEHPVNLGPFMIHFTKDESTFRRFALELLSQNENLSKISRIGVDLESAIFKGFKGLLPNLNRLVCIRHLM